METTKVNSLSDDLFGNFVEPTKSDIENLEERFQRERLEWNNKIAEMSKSLKNVYSMQDLMLTIYTERQLCIEYYNYILSLLITINKKYRKDFADKHKYYTYNSQERFTSETLKSNRILADLGDLVEQKDRLELHSKFMYSTVESIDKIIWAVSQRIKLEELSRGIK